MNLKGETGNKNMYPHALIFLGYSKTNIVRATLSRIAEREMEEAKNKSMIAYNTDYSDSTDGTNIYVNDEFTESGSDIITCLFDAIHEAQKDFEGFSEFVRLLRSQEDWRHENKRALYAPARKPMCMIIIARPVLNRRLMFPVSGHLPWRDRKRMRNR